MKEDILFLLLQAESEYHSDVKTAVREADNYVKNRRKEQESYIEELKQKLALFEKTESDMLERRLIADSGRMEEEAVKVKKKMKIRQQEKADKISDILKEEVLSRLWR